MSDFRVHNDKLYFVNRDDGSILRYVDFYAESPVEALGMLDDPTVVLAGGNERGMWFKIPMRVSADSQNTTQHFEIGGRT